MLLSKFLKPVITVCLSLAFFFAGSSSSMAQVSGGTASGRVLDTSGLPLPGAYVVVMNSNGSRGAVVDLDGNFTVKAKAGEVLEISLLGFTTVTVTVPTSGKLQNIVLKEDSVMLNEVVMIGYGSQRKETVTGAISTVNNEKLLQSPTANVSNALVGRLPGISSVQSSGEPGDDMATLRIRGISTFNSEGQEPLVVIDGVQSTMDVMNLMDPHDISSISILKDASATAVYGVKGANGVIIVTTKRGDAGKPKITFSARYGLSELTTKLRMLDSYHYALLKNEAIRRDGELISAAASIFTEDDLWKFQNNRDYTPQEIEQMDFLTPEQKAQLANSPAMYYTSHDYYNEQFGGMSPQYQYNINVQGGTDRVRYFTSVGYNNQKGLFGQLKYENVNNNSEYERYNFRSNVDIDVTKRTTLSIDLNGSFESGQGVLGKDGSDLSDPGSRHKEMLVMVLCTPPYGGPGLFDGKLIGDYISDFVPESFRGKGGGGMASAAYLLTRGLLMTRSSNFNASVKLNHYMDYLTPGLKFAANVSYHDTYRKSREYWSHPSSYSMGRNPSNPNEIIFWGGSAEPIGASDNLQAYNNKYNSLYLEARLEYERTFGKHNVAALILANAQQQRSPGFSYTVPKGMMGSAARVTYNYDSRYMAEFDMGYNGSENFPKGHRFGFFPAVSLGYIITNEPFFPKNNFLTFLKLRASRGQVGNDSLGGGSRFLYLPSAWAYTTSSGESAYFGITDGTNNPIYYQGAYESTVGNPNVTWERATKTNVGADIRFFRDRLSIEADWFNEDRVDILWSYGTSPAIIGISPSKGNIGKMNNHGYEIQLGWSDRKGDFGYSLGAGVSYARNKILYMDEPENEYEWMNQTGYSYGVYRGYISEGFYNTNAESANRPYLTFAGNKVQPGDIRYVDLNGDGRLDSKDIAPVADSNIPLYTYNGTIGFSYKRLTVDALFTGSYGGNMRIASHYMLNPFYMGGNSAQWFHYEDRWTEEKVEAGITPKWPRASRINEDNQNGQNSDFYLRSTRHVKLKNLEVAYTFAGKFLQRFAIQGMRVYFSANNVFTWGSQLWDGYDPEQADTGGAADGYLYPPTRTYNLGVNVQF